MVLLLTMAEAAPLLLEDMTPALPPVPPELSAHLRFDQYAQPSTENPFRSPLDTPPAGYTYIGLPEMIALAQPYVEARARFGRVLGGPLFNAYVHVKNSKDQHGTLETPEGHAAVAMAELQIAQARIQINARAGDAEAEKNSSLICPAKQWQKLLPVVHARLRQVLLQWMTWHCSDF